MLMILHDVSSRIIYLQGEVTITTAIQIPSASEPIENGMCTYDVRFELIPKGTPEANESNIRSKIITTWEDIYSERGKPGGRMVSGVVDSMPELKAPC